MMNRAVLFFVLPILAVTVLSDASAAVVNSVAALQGAVNAANSGGDKNIRIADGVYDLSGIALQISADGMSIRSESGDRNAVILDNHYIEGGTSGIFRIVSSNVTIADMTLQHPYYHAVHISPAGTAAIENIVLDNLHIIDPGEQAVKINASASGPNISNGTIQNCLIELTDTGRTKLTYTGYPCYTGGIDGHWSVGWTIRDNVIQGFWCSDGLSEHGIHFWKNSSNILVERNKIIDCDRGIGFGLGSDGNSGGIIRNNMISHGSDHGYADVGISIESTPDARVYNNTVYHEHNYSAIEYRFAASADILINNNLTNRAITRRDGATGQVENNITSALPAWFINPSAGDLHLASALTRLVNQGLAINGLTDDFDKGIRPYNGGYDIGADEFGSGESTPPPPPTPQPGKNSITPVFLLLLENTE